MQLAICKMDKLMPEETQKIGRILNSPVLCAVEHRRQSPGATQDHPQTILQDRTYQWLGYLFPACRGLRGRFPQSPRGRGSCGRGRVAAGEGLYGVKAMFESRRYSQNLLHSQRLARYHLLQADPISHVESVSLGILESSRLDG